MDRVRPRRGAFLFVMGHGASMWVSYQIRRERDVARIKVLLEMSRRSLGMVYGSLLTLLVAGIAAGSWVGHFGRGWIWAAIVRPRHDHRADVRRWRRATTAACARQSVSRSYQTPKDAPDPTPVSEAELSR